MNIIISSATHRSGSTLLQRIFNVRKETLIWGEHGGCLTQLCKGYDIVLDSSQKYNNQRVSFLKDKEDQWTATMNPDVTHSFNAAISATKAFFDTLYSQHKDKHDVIGFKEVSYGKKEISLLKHAYPNIKSILLVRHPIDVWKSAHVLDWYPYSVQEFADMYIERTLYYYELSQNDPNTYLIRYEDIANKKPETLSLISDLSGVPIKEYEHVLSAKIANTLNKTISKEHENYLRVKCQKVMQLLGY